MPARKNGLKTWLAYRAPWAEAAQAARAAQIVIHMAAKVGVQEVISDSLDTLEVNHRGTSNVLKSIADSQNCERVLVFSTSEVFGVRAFNITESGDSILSSVQDVRWCYCISKLAAEQLAFSYFRQKGLPVVVIRPFNIFGPNRVGDHVVVRFILSALQNEDLQIYGDGTQIRAWCYIDDFCDGVLRAMEAPRAVGQAFNIGNHHNTITIHGLAKNIIDLCGSKSRIVFKSLNFADIDIRVPNTSKARNILGFVPKVELEEGLTKTIEWIKDNMDKWKTGLKKRQIAVIEEIYVRTMNELGYELSSPHGNLIKLFYSFPAHLLIKTNKVKRFIKEKMGENFMTTH